MVTQVYHAMLPFIIYVRFQDYVPIAHPIITHLYLKRKSHQSRIQHNRQQKMTRPNNRHRENRHKIRNHPTIRNERAKRQDENGRNANEADRKTIFEPLEHARHFDEEVGELCFLGRCAPLHVVLEHVGEQGRGDVEREAAKEDGEHEDPFEVFEEGGEEGVRAEAVAKEGEGDVAQACEDDYDGEPSKL